MKLRDYRRLYKYLTGIEGYSTRGALHVMGRLRGIDPELLRAFEDKLLRQIEPEIEINGVSYAELTHEEGMNPVRAILMLDWLKKEPAQALRYMATERWRGGIEPLAESEIEMLNRAKLRLEERGVDIRQYGREIPYDVDGLDDEVPEDEDAEIDNK